MKGASEMPCAYQHLVTATSILMIAEEQLKDTEMTADHEAVAKCSEVLAEIVLDAYRTYHIPTAIRELLNELYNELEEKGKK